ncbi:hypothetical protein T06_824 [Trichinella sp. T6]|nr:hypothetical protein T06_824 [Trichinella sp. T6]
MSTKFLPHSIKNSLLRCDFRAFQSGFLHNHWPPPGASLACVYPYKLV